MTKNIGVRRADYTGLVILAFVAPLFLLFIYLGQPDIGRTASYCLGMILLAVRIRWDLRKEVWFWGVMTLMLVLHVPLVLLVRWPHRWIPAIAILPIAVLDCLIILGVVRITERVIKAQPVRN